MTHVSTATLFYTMSKDEASDTFVAAPQPSFGDILPF